MDYASKFAQELHGKFGESYKFSVEYGRKFDRIVQTNLTGTNGYVHAFVERATGKLVKAAGWNAPAKYVGGVLASKYDLSDETEYMVAVHESDPYGGYLYAR
jgi:hypothetical protein